MEFNSNAHKMQFERQYFNTNDNVLGWTKLPMYFMCLCKFNYVSCKLYIVDQPTYTTSTYHFLDVCLY